MLGEKNTTRNEIAIKKELGVQVDDHDVEMYSKVPDSRASD